MEYLWKYFSYLRINMIFKRKEDGKRRCLECALGNSFDDFLGEQERTKAVTGSLCSLKAQDKTTVLLSGRWDIQHNK